MRAVRSKNTRLEVAFRNKAWKNGLRYRKNSNKYFGKPDLAIKKHKLVVFLDSCFWHSCPRHCRMPSSNKKYWERKIARNKQRDTETNRHYKDKGWVCLRFWEHELKTEKDVEHAVKKLEIAAAR